MEVQRISDGGTPSRYTSLLGITGLGSAVGRVSAPRSGGTGFVPGPRHTKVFNNGTSCSDFRGRASRTGLSIM